MRVGLPGGVVGVAQVGGVAALGADLQRRAEVAGDLRGAPAPEVVAHEQLEVGAQRALPRRAPATTAARPRRADRRRSARPAAPPARRTARAPASRARSSCPRIRPRSRSDRSGRPPSIPAAPAPASTGTVLSSMPSAAKSGPRAPPIATPSSCSITCPDQPLVRTRPTGTGRPSASASVAQLDADQGARVREQRLEIARRPT